MRVGQGRGYWEARHRIDGLRRFAFLGDSYVFGQGVATDETLPACAERHLNEAAGGGLIEAINLGVNGYNLWNAWLSFKRVPQVFDAVVLSLCSNDAQLFGRTFRIDYANKTSPYWQPDHAFRTAVESCFDDVAAFARQNDLAVAVCYNSIWPGPPAFAERVSRKIAAEIASLSSVRGLPFIDFEEHLESRRVPFEELIVGAGENHPSKFAHDTAARHLVRTLRDLGWLAQDNNRDLVGTPDRILQVAHDMATGDFYPHDAAVDWAEAALESKRRSARRTLEGTEAANFERHADRASARIAAAKRAWRTQAISAATAQLASSLSGGLGFYFSYVDEEMLRLEELAYAIKSVDRTSLAESLVGASPSRPTITDNESSETPAVRLHAIADDLAEFPVAYKAALYGSDWLGCAGAGALSSGASGVVLDLADRIERKAREILALIEQIEPQFAAAAAADAAAIQPLAPKLLADSLANASRYLEVLHQKLARIVTLEAPAAPAVTTVDVTVAAEALEGHSPCTLQVWLCSAAPHRLPLQNLHAFQPDGGQALVRFRFPAIYAGQVMIQFIAPGKIVERAKPEIVRVDIYNAEGPHRALAADDLTRDRLGRYVSPAVYLA